MVEYEEKLKEARFEMKDLNHFSVGPKGITFMVGFGFIHALKGLEPEGEYLIPYAKLKPYLRPDSPLNVFAR
jgi:hypothetical protein